MYFFSLCVTADYQKKSVALFWDYRVKLSFLAVTSQKLFSQIEVKKGYKELTIHQLAIFGLFCI